MFLPTCGLLTKLSVLSVIAVRILPAVSLAESRIRIRKPGAEINRFGEGAPGSFLVPCLGWTRGRRGKSPSRGGIVLLGPPTGIAGSSDEVETSCFQRT